MKHWMIVTVDTEIDWPTAELAVDFMGKTLIMRPPDGDSAPDVRLEYDHPQEEREAFETICRFLSAMSWWNRRPARACMRIACTAPMRGSRRIIGPPAWDDFYVQDSVKTPADPKARLAIALYREAISIRNTPYEFLGYFKIINILHNRPESQIAWINAALPALADAQAKARVAELQSAYSDVGAYLYGSGRCAVAHAFGSPTVDPDDPNDIFRLSADMPVARALAEEIILNHFKLPRR